MIITFLNPNTTHYIFRKENSAVIDLNGDKAFIQTFALRTIGVTIFNLLLLLFSLGFLFYFLPDFEILSF